MKDAALGSGTRTRFGQIAGFFQILLTEYRRAIAADARYEDLKRMNAVARMRDGVACSDIPRRVFNELYSSGGQAPGAAPPLGALRAERFKKVAVGAYSRTPVVE